METKVFKTEDGIDIEALYWDAGTEKSILLLHMMPATKESWIDFAEKLVAQGFNVLAPDFRGHGRSSGGDYKTFTPEDHQKYYRDAVAAANFLELQQPDTLVALGGASIGANIALQFMTEHLTVKKGFFLSAGLYYHGVRAVDFVPKLAN